MQGRLDDGPGVRQSTSSYKTADEAEGALEELVRAGRRRLGGIGGPPTRTTRRKGSLCLQYYPESRGKQQYCRRRQDKRFVARACERSGCMRLHTQADGWLVASLVVGQLVSDGRRMKPDLG